MPDQTANLIIEPYKPIRDKAAIRTMLGGKKQFDEMFQESDTKFPKEILVARYNGLTVGFLTFIGFKRETDTTIFVTHTNKPAA